MCSDHEYADCVTQYGIRAHDIHEALLGARDPLCAISCRCLLYYILACVRGQESTRSCGGRVWVRCVCAWCVRVRFVCVACVCVLCVCGVCVCGVLRSEERRVGKEC